MSISEGIYIGKLTHQRSYPKAHHFQYKHVMLALDVDSNKTSSFIFGLINLGYCQFMLRIT